MKWQGHSRLQINPKVLCPSSVQPVGYCPSQRIPTSGYKRIKADFTSFLSSLTEETTLSSIAAIPPQLLSLSSCSEFGNNSHLSHLVGQTHNSLFCWESLFTSKPNDSLTTDDWGLWVFNKQSLQQLTMNIFGFLWGF